MPPLMACKPLPAAESPPLHAAEEYPNLNMTMNECATGAERPATLSVEDTHTAMVGIPDPIRDTVESADAGGRIGVGRYPVVVHTERAEGVTFFQLDRFPGSVGAHLEFPSYSKSTYYGGYGDNSESRQDDPWRRGNVNKPHGISYSRLIDIITGQNRVAGETP